MSNLARDVDSASVLIEQMTRKLADELAAEHNATNETVLILLMNSAARRVLPARGLKVDSRDKRYCIHAAIFDSRHEDAARWDSRDAEPGGYVVAGLPGVWSMVMDTAKAWHAAQGHLDDGGQLVGLDMASSIRGQRPTMSRRWTSEKERAEREGREPVPQTTQWRIRYQTFDNVGGKGGWIIRIDITPHSKDDANDD